MEAFEKSQLPIDMGAAPGADGIVRALHDRLVIERLTVTDERAARVVRERAEAGQEPARTVRDVIEIGARVLEREGAAAEVDYVRAEFERHAAELRERLTKALDAGDLRLAERIAQSFDGSRDGSVQGQIRELVRSALEEQRTSLVRLFSADQDANPLSDFKGAVVRAIRQSDARHVTESQESRKRIDALTRELLELKERGEADRRVAEAEEAGTRKGRSFEERVHEAIERIAGARGDVAHHVGDERGEGGSKKGDTLVEVSAADGPATARIVFEAKDERLSKNEAWKELNGGMAERDAGYAVLVVAGESRVPAGREELVEYEGNKLIVAVDPDEPLELGLKLAYRYARLRVQAARARSLEVDAAGVRDAAEAARSALKRAQSIRLALTNIDKSSVRAREGLDGICRDVEAELERIETLIAAAATE